jgi:hypothetical protein
LDTLLSNSNPLRQSFLYLIVATFIIFRNKYHRPNNEMAQLFNPYHSNGKLGGKGKKKTLYLTGTAPTRKNNCTYVGIWSDSRRGRGKTTHHHHDDKVYPEDEELNHSSTPRYTVEGRRKPPRS